MPGREVIREAGEDLLERIATVMRQVNWDDFLELARMVRAAPATFVTGAGRSGLVAQSFGMRLMHAGLTAYIPGETITPAAKQGDLLVGISCTGTTGYTEYLAARAKGLGATVVVLTAEPESQLARAADKVIQIPAIADNIVIRAGVFEHASSLCLDAVFNALSDTLRVDEETFQKRHANLE